MRKTVLTVIFIACLALAATSQAKPLPGNPAVDQYTEGVPTAEGQSSPQGGGAGGGTLPPGTAESLGSQGKDGAKAAALAQATAPAPASGAGEGDTDSSGLGIWLWLILAATLLATLTIYFGRRRTSSPAA